jgi:hypothetical protein
MSDPDIAARLQRLESQVEQLTAALAEQAKAAALAQSTATALTAVFIEEASLSSGMPANIIETKLAKARERLAKPAAPAIPRRM